jgi:hypothetical protein
MVLFTTFVQNKFRPCKLNLDRTVYTVFRNIRYSSKSLNVLNTVFSKQNISCFEIRWPRPIWSVSVFFMHSASAVCIYRAQRKHINYSIWPMRISRHDLRRRYSNSLVIDAGSQFNLRACSQAMNWLILHTVYVVTLHRAFELNPDPNFFDESLGWRHYIKRVQNRLSHNRFPFSHIRVSSFKDQKIQRFSKNLSAYFKDFSKNIWEQSDVHKLRL